MERDLHGLPSAELRMWQVAMSVIFYYNIRLLLQKVFFFLISIILNVHNEIHYISSLFWNYIMMSTSYLHHDYNWLGTLPLHSSIGEKLKHSSYNLFLLHNVHIFFFIYLVWNVRPDHTILTHVMSLFCVFGFFFSSSGVRASFHLNFSKCIFVY